MKKWLSKFTGLNNRVADTRIRYNIEEGVSELSQAVNVDIDESGRISRRRGITATAITTSSHSLFSTGSEAYFVCGSSLYQLFPDYSTNLIRDELSLNMLMYYCFVNNRVYYSNNHELGYIENGEHHDWVASEYVGYTTHKTFTSPQPCTIIEHHAGRIYIVVLGKWLMYSELYAHAWFDNANNYFPFTTEITMVASVTKGLYVSDSNFVYFMPGNDPVGMDIKIVSMTPAIARTSVKTQGKFINRGSDGKVVIWTSTDGIWCGDEDGNVTNLTKDSLTLPSGNVGAAVVNEVSKKYITIINP